MAWLAQERLLLLADLLCKSCMGHVATCSSIEAAATKHDSERKQLLSRSQMHPEQAVALLVRVHSSQMGF